MMKPWINLMMLAAESQQVIGLRVMQDLLCDHEGRLGLSLWPAAANHAMGHLMMGATPDTVIAGVRQKIHFFCMDLPQSDACFVKAYPCLLYTSDAADEETQAGRDCREAAAG